MLFDGHLLAYCMQEPSHDIFLVRWPLGRVMHNDLSQPQWWAGEGEGWVPQRELARQPQPLFSQGHTEFTVHYEAALGRFLEIQTVGFGPADLGFRLADQPAGPWSPLEGFYRPEEHNLAKIMIYAAKAHPHLRGADLVLTYATNSLSYARLVADNRLYYPRFLKASQGKPPT